MSSEVQIIGIEVRPTVARTTPGMGDEYLAALAAGLPSHGFWSASVVACVSGGADSVALLLGLQALARARGVAPTLIVAHARHDLRAEASADADFVAKMASALGFPCVIRDLLVREPDGRRGEGIEGRSRRLRYDFFTALARERGARFVVVAHTADDQAETILHRTLRGTGLAGLAGMAPARELGEGVSLLRPLLGVPRSVIRSYLGACEQPWVEDATNADVRYARNFLRHDILPRCEAGPYPAAVSALVRLGGQAAAVAGALRSAAEHLLDTHSHRHADGTILLQTRKLTGLDRHLLAEMFVALWCREGWPQRDMTARHYLRLVDMTASATEPDAADQTAWDLPGGLRAGLESSRMLAIRRAGVS